MEDRLPRKLAVILSADVASYSRLTGEDEDATHRTLSEYLDLISASVQRHEGKAVFRSIEMDPRSWCRIIGSIERELSP